MPARRALPLWSWWIAVVLLVSAPWFGFTTTPQWDRLILVPFSDPQDKPRDVLSNALLFVPFGVSFFAHRRTARLAATAGAACLVSIAAETPQLFSTLRHPSATDVLMAVVGATAGGVLRLAWERVTPGDVPAP